MPIGIDRSAGYFFAGTTGTLIEPGQSIALYVVNAGVNLSAEDDAANEAYEAIIQAFPPVLAYYAHPTSGVISLVCDGVNAPDAASLQTALQAIGTKKGSVNLSSATVTSGTSFVVS